MGKKGKGNKLVKMSEEQRARYLQLRADMEEEARRRKMQLIALFMKNKLKREEAFCRLNMAKINQQWRTILRQVKCQELRQEIIEMEKYCRTMMDHKDNVICRLLNDLEVAHGQHDNISQSHMEMLQHFTNIQQQRVEFFHDNYENEKQLLLQEFHDDSKKLQDMMGKSQQQLEKVYYQLDELSESKINEAHEKYLDKLDDIKAEMQLRIEEITEKGEQKLEKLWREYQQALADYVSYTESFYADYMDLKERDDKYTEQIREYCYAIEKASNRLASLKLSLADAEENSEAKLRQLKMMREQLTKKLKEVKEQVGKEMQENEEKFRLASVESHKAVKLLSAKGNAILQLAETCRKLETDKEKVSPFGLPPITKTMFENEEEVMFQFPEAIKTENFRNWFLMEDFWKRVNNVKVDVVCLTHRKKFLEKENAQLKAELQDRLINLNLSNGVNSHVKDYLVKRPSSMRLHTVERISLDARQQQCQSADAATRNRILRPISCITEATLTNAVRSKMLAKRRQQKFGKTLAIKH